MEHTNAILPFNIIDSYSNLKKQIEEKNEGHHLNAAENESSVKRENNEMTADNIQQGEILEPEAEELLPKHWKIAYDNSGKRYYYHEISRKTQWDLPVEVIPTEIKNK